MAAILSGKKNWTRDVSCSIVRIPLRDLMMNSKYYDDLDAVAQRRYRQKLEIAGLPSSVFSRAFRGAWDSLSLP